MNLKIFLPVVVFFVFVGFPNTSKASNTILRDTITEVVFYNKVRLGETVRIKEGEKVVLFLNSNQVVRGTVVDIVEGGMKIEGNFYNFDEIEAIRIKDPTYTKKLLVVMAYLSGSSIIGLVFSIWGLSNSYSSNISNFYESMFLIGLLVFLFSFVFLSLAFIGFIASLFNYKKFYLSNWDIRVM
ncbi:MAG: hypothetical protein JXL97_11330 [Bacteroidales bacterium]|nr:hypothetical protein [Bacteroidales bacterium]